DLGEPSSSARNFSPTRTSIRSRSFGLAPSDLWSSPHIHRWACTLTIITPLDRVAPRLGDIGGVRLRCLCHRASRLSSHRAPHARLSPQSRGETRLGVVAGLRLDVGLRFVLPFLHHLTGAPSSRTVGI